MALEWTTLRDPPPVRDPRLCVTPANVWALLRDLNTEITVIPNTKMDALPMLSIEEDFETRLFEKETIDHAINERKNNAFESFVVQARSLFPHQVPNEQRATLLVAAFMSTYPLTSSTAVDIYHQTQCPYTRETIIKTTLLARMMAEKDKKERRELDMQLTNIDKEIAGFF